MKKYLIIACCFSLLMGSCSKDECMEFTWYEDADEDGYGNPNRFIAACEMPVGYVANKLDCDDAYDTVYPGAPEICDGRDNNCEGNVDEMSSCGPGFECISGSCQEQKQWYQDSDGDLYGDPDNFVVAVEQPSGHVLDNTDCNDSNADINPGAPELCNGVDDNCSGVTDDTATCPEGQVCDGVNGCIPT